MAVHVCLMDEFTKDDLVTWLNLWFHVFLLFLMVPEEGCDLWLWHSLEMFSLFSCMEKRKENKIRKEKQRHQKGQMSHLVRSGNVILQTRVRSHPVGLDVWFFVEPFVYFHTLCVRTATALARLRGCAGSPEPSLVAYVLNTIISWAASNVRVGNGPSFKCVHTSLEMTIFHVLIEDLYLR